MASPTYQPAFTSTLTSASPHSSTTNLNTNHTIPLQNLQSPVGASNVASTSANSLSATTTLPTSSLQISVTPTLSAPGRSQSARTQKYVQTLPGWDASSLHQPTFIKDFLQDLLTFENVLVPAYKLLIALVSATSTKSPEDLLYSSTDAPFAHFLTELGDRLKQARESELSMCCVMAIPGQDAGVRLPLQSRMFRDSARIRRKHETPRLAILLTIAERWNLPKRLVKDILTTRYRHDLLVPLIKFKSRQQPLSRPLFYPTWKIYRLAWCHGIPEWKSGFHMYIWELHQTIPSIERATVLVNQASEQNWQILVLRTSTSDPSLSIPEPFLSESRTMFGAHRGGGRVTADAVASVLLSILEMVSSQLKSFRDRCVLRISEMRMQGRRRPSRHKINFLNHLDDFRQEAQRSLPGAEGLLADILEHVSPTNAPTSSGDPPNSTNTLQSGSASSHPQLRDLPVRCKDIKDELEFLACNFDELEKLIRDAQEMVKQQIELRQIGLSMVLTFLAAIYLPFSFIAGMFGMNVKEPLWPYRHQTQNTARADEETDTISVSSPSSTTQPTPHSIPDLTSAFEGALSKQPSNFLWSFKQFWYIAVAVTAATIFLPIIAGPMFRSIVKFSDKHKELWHAAVFICSVAGLIALTVFQGLWTSIILGALQSVIAASGLVRSHIRVTRVMRWIAYAAILAACILNYFPDVPVLMEVFHDKSHPWPALTGIIPPIWLFILWMRAGRKLVDVRALEKMPVYGPPFARVVSCISSLVQHVRNSPKTKRRIYAACIFLGAAGLNCYCNLVLPSRCYMGLSFVSFGLYAAHKLYWAISDRKDRSFWFSFAIITLLSDVWWWHNNIGRYAGASVMIPAVTLWDFRSKGTLQYAWETVTKRIHHRDQATTSTSTV